jgi:signal transduction histidine kinase/CheY-like chemotaxis protein
MMTRSLLLTFLNFCLNIWVWTAFVKPFVAARLLIASPATLEQMTSHLQWFGIEVACIVLIGLVLRFKEGDNMLLTFFEQKKHNEELTCKLVKAVDELNQAIKDKDEFLLGISHELRNPLNIILGNLELAITNPQHRQLSNYLNSAKISGEMLTHLINNLLDAGKLQNRSLEIAAVPTNTFSFIEKMWVTTKFLIQRRNLDGCLFISKNIPENLVIDPHRLMQIIFNLVSNAAKFTVSGSIVLIISWIKTDTFNEKLLEPTKNERFRMKRITSQTSFSPMCGKRDHKISMDTSFHEDTECHEEMESDIVICPFPKLDYKTIGYVRLLDDYYKLDYNTTKLARTPRAESLAKCDGYLKIEVRDTGCGMTPEELEKLFGKFSQVGTDKRKSQLGSGLGLWITHSLCESMKGAIQAYSVKGEGSTFVAALKTTTNLPVNMVVRNKKYKAMVVHSKSQQQLTKSFLESCGVEAVNVVSNGLEAFELYKEKGNKSFNMIFMDLELPEMDGAEACERIREYETQMGWKPVIIVIITGRIKSDDFDKYLNPQGIYRANYLYGKPFTLQQCQDIIDLMHSKSINSYQSEREIQLGGFKRCKETSLGLVVDDDQFNCKIVGEYMERYKLKTMQANNGKEAVDKFIEFYNVIGVIFMDCDMPVMNGYEASTTIKQLIKKNKWPDVKIIGLTGHCSVEAKKKCLAAGMDFVLTKPMSYSQLQMFVENHFQ